MHNGEPLLLLDVGNVHNGELLLLPDVGKMCTTVIFSFCRLLRVCTTVSLLLLPRVHNGEKGVFPSIARFTVGCC